MTATDGTGEIRLASTWTDHRTGRVRGRVLVVHLHGEFDEATGVTMAGLIQQALAQRPSILVVDLTEVAFFGSAALSALVGARRRAEGAGIALGLVAARRVTLLPLELTGLTRVFAVFPTVHQALAALCGKDTGDTGNTDALSA